MFKAQLYKATKRVTPETFTMQITEKLDGSNLCFYVHDGALYVAQRTKIFTAPWEIDQADYKGLKGWLTRHWHELALSLRPDTIVCGEWLGMGRVKYPKEFTERSPWFMFAEGFLRFEGNCPVIESLSYNTERFYWVFEDGELPDCVNVVPVVASAECPNIFDLEKTYTEYCEDTDRPVEGLVISDNDGHAWKYVRRKNGKLQDHFWSKKIPNQEIPKRITFTDYCKEVGRS